MLIMFIQIVSFDFVYLFCKKILKLRENFETEMQQNQGTSLNH